MNKLEIGLKAWDVLSPILMVALTWVALKASQLINTKVKNETLRSALISVDDAVYRSVREVQQVVVDDLKAASPTGQLSPEDKAKVKKDAIDAAKSYLGSKGLNLITQVVGIDSSAVDKFLSTHIEAAVHDLKTKSQGSNGATGYELPVSPAVAP
jgi:hypothetical protein